MAYKYQGDSNLGVSLNITTPKPLDIRTVVNDVSDLYTIPKESAYAGMTVGCVSTGNIYMLVDKEKITQKIGWKASYETIQIITCSKEEYDTWQDNTNPQMQPIDESLPYIHEDVYYYIYEEDNDQKYLMASWGKEIEKQLGLKATKDELNNLRNLVNTTTSDIKNTYLAKTEAESLYAKKQDLNLEDPQSFLSTTLSKYYTIQSADAKFVTKDELKEDPGQEDFIFITKKKYTEDKLEIDKILNTTLKTNTDGVLNSLTVQQLKSKESPQLIINLKNDGLYVGDNILAKLSDVPKIQLLSETEYEQLETKDPDTYYYTYTDDLNKGYITQDYMNGYYKKFEVDQLIADLKAQIQKLKQL